MENETTRSEAREYYSMIYLITEEIVAEYNKNPIKNKDGKYLKILSWPTADHKVYGVFELKINNQEDILTGCGLINFKYELDFCSIDYLDMLIAINYGSRMEITLTIADPQFIEQAAQHIRKIMQRSQDSILASQKLKELIESRPELIRGTKYPLIGTD